MWVGADFKLKICKVDGYWNYDKSEFSSPTPLLGGDDDKLKRVYDTLYNLNDFRDPQKFKSYDELKNRLDLVLGLKGEIRNKIDPEVESEVDDEYEKLVESKKNSSKVTPVSSDSDDEDDDSSAFSYFEKLASM